jgi:Cdc6-like AAA superfamily ATPase
MTEDVQDRIRESLASSLSKTERARYKLWGIDLNPFPLASVSSPEEVTDLGPLNQSELDPIFNFLSAKKPAILQVAGDYGTGKTHLLLWLRSMIQSAGGGQFGAYYVTNPGTSPRDLVARVTRAIGEEDLSHKVRQLVIRAYVDDYSKEGFSAVRPLFVPLGTATLSDEAHETAARELADPKFIVNDTGWELRARECFKEWRQFLDFAGAALTRYSVPRGVASELISFAFTDHTAGTESWSRLATPTNRVKFTFEDHYKGIVSVLLNTGYKKVFFLVDELEDAVVSGRVTKRQSSEFLAALRILLDERLDEVGIVLAGTPRAWEALGSYSPALKSRTTYRLDLVKLDHATARRLIDKYLVLAKYQKGEPPVTEEAIRRILSASEGNRRRFISLCNQVFAYAAQENRAKIDDGLVKTFLTEGHGS